MILEYLPEYSQVNVLGIIDFDLFLLANHVLQPTLRTFIELKLFILDIFESVDSELLQKVDKFFIKVAVLKGFYFHGKLLNSLQRHEQSEFLYDVKGRSDDIFVLLTCAHPQHFYDFRSEILLLKSKQF